MINIRNVFFLGMMAIIPLNGFCQTVPEDNYLGKIFLPNVYSLTDVTRILLDAKKSFSALKKFEDETNVKEQLTFAQSYANFLWDLLNKIRTNNTDVFYIFEEESLFLNGNKTHVYPRNVNASELKSVIYNLQYAAERVLIPFYNISTADSLGVLDFLNLKESELEDFSAAKLKLAKTNTGYFLLEVFATLIGLSWGLISTILYSLDGSNGQM